MDCSNAEIQKVSNTSLLWKWFLFVVKGGSGATPKIKDLKGYFVSAAEPSSLLLTAFDRSNAGAVSVFCKFVFLNISFSCTPCIYGLYGLCCCLNRMGQCVFTTYLSSFTSFCRLSILKKTIWL